MTLTFRSGQGLSFHELMRMAAATAGTYVFPNSAGGAVTPSSGMTVSVAAITGNLVTINGVVQSTNAALQTVTAGASSSTLTRIDTVYYDGTATLGIAAGTPVLASATVFPVPPTLAAGRIAVANLYIGIGYTTIGASDIDDRRQGTFAIVPASAGAAATAAIPLVYDTTAAAMKVWNGSASVVVGQTVTNKYKTATQVFTATTTFANVTASSGNFAFDIGANEVWAARFTVPLSFGGTGGIKFQLTGPAAPTAVSIMGWVANVARADAAAASGQATESFPVVTAFSTAVISLDSSAGLSVGTIHYGYTAPLVEIVAFIANGANAGTVTLQAAQNSANSTTTLGIGSLMRAEKVA